jgi:uncharacterized protein (TIGR02300 family)
VTKPELGTKRSCARCGAKFYDLNHSPITCPKCGAVSEAVQASSRPRAAPREPARDLKPVAAESLEARSREDADADAQDEKNSGEASAGKDDVNNEGFGDAAFIEEREDTDVSEIIGGDMENEKDT